MDDKRQDRQINEGETEGDTVERKVIGQRNEIGTKRQDMRYRGQGQTGQRDSL